MVLVIIFCLSLTVVIPLLIALMETHRKRFDPQDDGFWTVARAVMGGCHIRWNPDPNPIIWFDIGVNQGRLHAYKKAGDTHWWIEGRIYLTSPLHFAARLCTPPQEALKSNLPNLKPFEEKEGKADQKLSSFSLESNDAAKLQQCLGIEEFKQHLKSFRDLVKLHQCEVVMANQVLLLRGSTQKDDRPGDLMEKFGPQLINLMRDLNNSLSSFFDRNRIHSLSQNECPVSAVQLDNDKWVCPDCQLTMHRKAKEIMKGCVNPHCEQSVDGVPFDVLEYGRPEIIMQEIEAFDLNSMQFMEAANTPVPSKSS